MQYCRRGLVVTPQVYGMDFSVYVQAVRLTLAEKGVDHELIEVNPFDTKDSRMWYLEYHPFGRMPAFVHGKVRLYESDAIARYIDEVFEGPLLQPIKALERARMNQALSILKSYAYPSWVWGLYVHRVERPKKGLLVDQQRINEAIVESRTVMEALAAILGRAEFLAGTDQLTLADLFCAPMMNCIDLIHEGLDMLGDHPNMARWWARMKLRDSVRAFVV